MSRSKKGKKSPGTDYWGKRPIGLGDHVTKGKRVGIKKERAKTKQTDIRNWFCSGRCGSYMCPGDCGE